MLLLSDQTIELGKEKDEYLPVKAASKLTGYSVQYLRQLLRTKVLSGIKIGQVWLVSLFSLEKYLRVVNRANDQRFGPQFLS